MYKIYSSWIAAVKLGRRAANKLQTEAANWKPQAATSWASSRAGATIELHRASCIEQAYRAGGADELRR